MELISKVSALLLGLLSGGSFRIKHILPHILE
jgi:hypothetical protein